MLYTTSVLFDGIVRASPASHVKNFAAAVRVSKVSFLLRTADSNRKVGQTLESYLSLDADTLQPVGEGRYDLYLSGWASLAVRAANMVDVEGFVGGGVLTLTALDPETGKSIGKLEPHTVEIIVEEVDGAEDAPTDDLSDPYHRSQGCS